jgi:CrcB protein
VSRTLHNVLLVGAGGFLGAAGRYLVSGWAQRGIGGTFPVGTLAVNVVGCFALGFANALAEGMGLFTPGARLVLFIGLLGGFTTFSSFAYETFALGRGDLPRAAANVTAQLVLGLGAVWIGDAMARGLAWPR